MRRLLNETYTILPTAAGSVVCYERGTRKEYLGSDGLWMRDQKNCDPFSDDHQAVEKIRQLQDESERR